MAWRQLFYKLPYDGGGDKWLSVLVTDTASTGTIYSDHDQPMNTIIAGASAVVGFDPFVLMRPLIHNVNVASGYNSITYIKKLVPLIEIPETSPATFTIGNHNYRIRTQSNKYFFDIEYTAGTWTNLYQSNTFVSNLSDHSCMADGPIFVASNINDLTTVNTNKSGTVSAGGYNTNNESRGYFASLTISNAGTYVKAFIEDLLKLTPVVLNPDPYEDGGGASSTGGGTGTFSETGDIVGIPSLPTLSAVDTGFITLFNPTATQVKQLASYMWSNSFDLATFKNIVANPMDCILGLTIVPVDPPNAGSKVVTVGNIATNVTLPYLSTQYVEVDCGTLNVQEFWGSYLDYSPYTKMSLYLPYIGIVPLDIDDVMNATITIKYHVDVLSGACVAYVLCNGTQLYTYIGQCSSNVPVTSNDFTNTVNGILGIAGSIGSLVATGGASAPNEVADVAGNAINALKPNIQKSGAMSGTGGLMGVQTPYLICQRPRQCVPSAQNTFTGYPSNITLKLGDLSGYTEVERIHLEGIPCTNDELSEIMGLLESGVFI